MKNADFHHTHPYAPFNLNGATKLIVGTLPPPRFTTGVLKPGDVDFCYGSIDGQLWPIMDRIFDLGLTYENTEKAVKQRKKFLRQRNIGICDIVASARRTKIDASDLGMQQVELRDVVQVLLTHPQIKTLLFTGGNSKNGPEYFFRRHLKEYPFSLEVVDANTPRIHKLKLPHGEIQTVSLTAPSGAANRAVGSMKEFQDLKSKDPAFTALDFRVLQYREHF
ncbi:uracil-DNA glycosylase family protein [Croceiramulus getboli]|nr:uracil-DNA glycosylase family protein [Flavobacteriaceae bacterium YJPT1-3]